MKVGAFRMFSRNVVAALKNLNNADYVKKEEKDEVGGEGEEDVKNDSV